MKDKALKKVGAVDILPPESQTERLVAEIKCLHERGVYHGQAAVICALETGRKLVELKAITPHGKWSGMFIPFKKDVMKKLAGKVKNQTGLVFDFSDETARNYMAAWNKCKDEVKALLPEQSFLIEADPSSISPDERKLREDTIDKVINEQTLSQLYFNWGITKGKPGHNFQNGKGSDINFNGRPKKVEVEMEEEEEAEDTEDESGGFALESEVIEPGPCLLDALYYELIPATDPEWFAEEWAKWPDFCASGNPAEEPNKDSFKAMLRAILEEIEN